MIRIVLRNGLAIHGDDLKRLSLKLQVHVAVRGSIRDPPELAFPRGNFDLRTHGAVHCHHFVRRLWLAATDLRTEVNAPLQAGRLRVGPNSTAAHKQDALWQADQSWKIGLYSLDHECAGHTIEHLLVTLSVRVRMIPVQAWGVVFRN